MCSYADTYGDIFAKRLLRCESVNEIGKERIHSPTDETAFQPNLAMSQANFSFSLKFCNNSFPQSSKSIESSELNAVLTFFFAAFELANNSSGSGRSLATFLFFEHGTDISHYSCHNSVYWLSLTKLRCSREHISLTKNTMRNACSQIGQHMPCATKKTPRMSPDPLPFACGGWGLGTRLPSSSVYSSLPLRMVQRSRVYTVRKEKVWDRSNSAHVR